jgi:hypothetical protein
MTKIGQIRKLDVDALTQTGLATFSRFKKWCRKVNFCVLWLQHFSPLVCWRRMLLHKTKKKKEPDKACTYSNRGSRSGSKIYFTFKYTFSI